MINVPKHLIWTMGVAALCLNTGSAATRVATALQEDRVLTPRKAGSRYFFQSTDGALYVREGRSSSNRLLAEAGTYVDFFPSMNGASVLLRLPSDSVRPESYPIQVVDARNGRYLERIESARLSYQPWTRNNRGFYYTSIDKNDGRERVYYHRTGEAIADDRIILSTPDQPDWSYDARVTDDGAFAVITISHPLDSNNRIYFIDLDNPGRPRVDAPVVRLVDHFSNRYTFVDNGGPYFFMLTDRDAPAGQVIMANTLLLRESRWPVAVPQSADTLEFVRTAGNEYIITVSRNSGKVTGRVYSPPSARETQRELQRRRDSLNRVNTDRARTRERGERPAVEAGVPDRPALRLNLLRELEVDEGAVIVAMNSVAHDDELFYTVRFWDGTTRTYLHNIKTRRTTYFNTAVGGN